MAPDVSNQLAVQVEADGLPNQRCTSSNMRPPSSSLISVVGQLSEETMDAARNPQLRPSYVRHLTT
jgi:hypothetical protein